MNPLYIRKKELEPGIFRLAGAFKHKYPDIQLEDIGAEAAYKLHYDKTLDSTPEKIIGFSHNNPAFKFLFISTFLVIGTIGYCYWKNISTKE